MNLRALLVAMLLSASLAGCMAKGSDYPDSYLLQADELPDGLKLSEVPEGMPLSGNPAQIPAELLSNMGEEFQGFAPDQVWIEFIENETSTSEFGSDGGLMIASGFWTDEAKAKAALEKIREDADSDVCGSNSEMGTVLQDRNIVVIIGGDETMKPWIPKIVSALEKKAHGLDGIC